MQKRHAGADLLRATGAPFNLLQRCGQSKVDQLELGEMVEHEVGCLHISMHDPVRVQVRQGKRQLHRPRLNVGKVDRCTQPGAQILARQHLHHKKARRAALARHCAVTKAAHNVRVTNTLAAHERHFGPEECSLLRGIRLCRADDGLSADLNRDALARLLSYGGVNSGKGTHAKARPERELCQLHLGSLRPSKGRSHASPALFIEPEGGGPPRGRFVPPLQVTGEARPRGESATGRSAAGRVLRLAARRRNCPQALSYTCWRSAVRDSFGGAGQRPGGRTGERAFRAERQA